MIKLSKQQGKKVGIFGLGITGRSVLEAINGIASYVICYDDSETGRNNLHNYLRQHPACSEDNIISAPLPKNKFLKDKYSEPQLLPLTDKAWQELDLIIISPGLPKTHLIFTIARNYNIPISSDLELFFEENKKADFIIISGTNGKSTTTALIYHILKKLGINYPMGGNIGLPVLTLPENQLGYVLELSSFQIDLLADYQVDFKIAILLNITPDHLNYHGSLTDYIKVKKQIFNNAMIKIIGTDNAITKNIFLTMQKAKVSNLISFSGNINSSNNSSNTNSSNINSSIANISVSQIPVSDPELQSTKQTGAMGEDNQLEDHQLENIQLELMDNYFTYQKYHFPLHPDLRGEHNFANIAASFAACSALGVKAEEILESIASFKSLEHRMQYLGSFGELSFYDDSKATNTAAAAASLAALDNIFWLAGGIFKEENCSLLDSNVTNIKKAYLFGQSKDLLADYLKENKVEYQLFNNLTEAFAAAIIDAQHSNLKKINILLAPACASYDQFSNFTERGQVFQNLVKNYTTK